MIDRIVNSALHSLQKRDLLNETEIELYRFGLNQLIQFWINIFTTLVIGIICNMVWQSVIFSTAYILLRRYAGGYHAKTSQICYVLSTLLIFGALQLIKCFPENSIWFLLFVVSFSTITIFIKAPVESINKPLNQNEEKAFKQITRNVLICEVVILILLIPIYIEISICMGIAIFSSALMLIIPMRER